MNIMEFQECSYCAAKPGSPTLCAPCLHNRAALDARWRYSEELIDKQRDWAKRVQRKAFMAGVVVGMVPLAVLVGLWLP